MSSGGWQVGEPPKWMVAPHPVKLGGRSGCKGRAKRRQRVKYGGATGVRYGGEEQIYITRLKKVGREEDRIKLYKSD